MKSKNSLFSDVINFYNKEAVPVLTKYEKERKQDILPVMVTRICVGTFIISFIGIFLTHNEIFILPLILSLPILMLYMNFSKNKNIKTVVDSNGKKAHTLDIPDDYEMLLKKDLMGKFLKLFGDGFNWSKESTTITINQSQSCTKQQDEILPKLIYDTDDIIENNTLPVPTKITEIRCGLLALSIIQTLLICLIFLIIATTLSSLYTAIAVIIAMIFLAIHEYVGLFIILIEGLLLLILWILAIGYLLKNFRSFKGVIISYNIPKHIKGHTVIVEKGYKAKFKDKDLKKIQLEDVVFNSKYDVYSDDEIECRYLLTTAFMSKFENIKTSFEAKNIRAEFKNGELSILIQVSKDLFKMGDIIHATNVNHFVIMFEEIYSVLELSTQLNLASKTGL